jgi:hypothetical protein
MNNEQVAHIWANKSRERATGSHFYFEGDTIYSYGTHFPIARHYKGIVLFTSRGHSVTTARHKSIVRSAINHLVSFTVDDVMAKPCGDDVKAYAARLENMATRASRARNPQIDIECLQRVTDEANKFCEMFGFKTRFSMPDDATLAMLKERSKLAQQKKAKQTAERNAKLERENAEAITEWLCGKRDSLPYTISKVFLRVNGENMQTSQGALVPLLEAQKAFRFVMMKRATGWHRNGDTFPIGEFHLDAVNEQGVVAGCHRVAWEEIERFAKSQS